MTEDEIINVANNMAFMACIWIKDESNEFKDMIKFGQQIAEAAVEKERNRIFNSLAGVNEE